MTSEHTKNATAKFFEDNNYFGLQPSNIMFFEQNMTPCIDKDGKILLESKCKLARAPGWIIVNVLFSIKCSIDFSKETRE